MIGPISPPPHPISSPPPPTASSLSQSYVLPPTVSNRSPHTSYSPSPTSSPPHPTSTTPLPSMINKNREEVEWTVGNKQWESMLADEIDEFEAGSMEQEVSDIEDQWGVHPAEFIIRRPTPERTENDPPHISEEGSTSAEDEEAWESRHGRQQLDPLLDTGGEGDINDTVETPARCANPSVEIRRSARLMSKSGPITISDRYEQAARIRSLEAPPNTRQRQAIQGDNRLGSVLIADMTYGRDDIAILVTSSGFEYSPSDSTTAAAIAERLESGGDGGR